MYNKLFLKILDSSIWLEPTTTRICWITLLAAMDEHGYAHFSAIQNLAERARVTLEEAQAAVDCFLAPDPNSGDPDNEGRRVERVPGGFMILNAGKHRETLNRVVALEQNRLRVKRFRERQSGTVSEPEASAKAKKEPPTIEEVKLAAAKIGLSDHEAEKFHAFYESNGWKVGKNAMKSMIGSLAGWKLRNQEKKAVEVNRSDTFWKDKSRLEMVEKEIARIEAQASHTALDMIVEPKDVGRYAKLKTERKALKTKMNL
jgi:hypothetical protein